MNASKLWIAGFIQMHFNAGVMCLDGHTIINIIALLICRIQCVNKNVNQRFNVSILLAVEVFVFFCCREKEVTEHN